MKEKVVCVFQRNKESSSQMLKTVSTYKHFSLNKKGNGYLGIGQVFLLSYVLKSLDCAERRQNNGRWVGKVMKLVGIFLIVAHWTRRPHQNIQQWNISLLSSSVFLSLYLTSWCEPKVISWISSGSKYPDQFIPKTCCVHFLRNYFQDGCVFWLMVGKKPSQSSSMLVFIFFPFLVVMIYSYNGILCN